MCGFVSLVIFTDELIFRFFKMFHAFLKIIPEPEEVLKNLDLMFFCSRRTHFGRRSTPNALKDRHASATASAAGPFLTIQNACSPHQRGWAFSNSRASMFRWSAQRTLCYISAAQPKSMTKAAGNSDAMMKVSQILRCLSMVKVLVCVRVDTSESFK